MPLWLADKNSCELSYQQDRANPDSDYYPCSPYNVAPTNYDKYEQMIRKGLQIYKEKYPEIVYIEVYNEPNWDMMTKDVYKEIYHRIANAVQDINGNLDSNVPKLKIGGPTVTGSPRLTAPKAWIEMFLDYVKANNLPLDFVSWHDYIERAQPAKFRDDTRLVKRMLSDRGMQAETFITEYARGADHSSAISAAGLAQWAAFYPAADYYMLEGGLDKPFYFSVTDYAGYIRSIIAPPGITTTDGKAFPVYNVMKMRSMLKTYRILATSDSLASSGLGVNGMATKDGSGVAIMVWNYQNTGTAEHDVMVDISNLPVNFQSVNIHYERYLVDSTHSNYAFNPAKDKLEKVDDRVLSPRAAHQETFHLEKNAITLILLTILYPYTRQPY